MKASRINSAGFSLLELMFATTILAVSILGFLSMTLTSMQVNKQNELRNTAIGLTSKAAEDLLSTPIDSIASSDTTTTVKVRGVDASYRIINTVSNLTNDLRQVNISVQWSYRGQSYTNDSVVFKHRAI